MGIIAQAVKHMLAAGMSHEAVVSAIEAMESSLINEPARSKNAERIAEYRRNLDIPIKEWNELRIQILQRDNYTCAYCGAIQENKSFHCDHVIPLSRGGKSIPDNLVCACKKCNSSKRDRTPEEWSASK